MIHAADSPFRNDRVHSAQSLVSHDRKSEVPQLICERSRAEAQLSVAALVQGPALRLAHMYKVVHNNRLRLVLEHTNHDARTGLDRSTRQTDHGK